MIYNTKEIEREREGKRVLKRWRLERVDCQKGRNVLELRVRKINQRVKKTLVRTLEQLICEDFCDLGPLKQYVTFKISRKSVT